MDSYILTYVNESSELLRWPTMADQKPTVFFYYY